MLYHYTSEKGLQGILKSKKLWLVSSMDMSDITDRFYGNLFATVALFKSDDEDVKLLREHLTMQDIIEVNMQTFNVQFYSASFCDKSDNDYLWRNYADSNKGFCIAIDNSILIKHMNTVVDNNLEKIDEDDEITENDKDILVPRTVRYGYPIDWFIKIIKDTKRIAISDEDINHPDSLSGEHYKYWLYFSLTILAGIVKDSNFEQEQETRFLFQNRYSDSYVRQNAIYALERMRISNIFKILGIDKEVKDNVNRRMELNLCGTFNSKLIPKIIVGNQCELDLNNLKELLKTSGLTETIILTRKGKQL